MVVRDYNPALRAAIKAAAGIKGISKAPTGFMDSWMNAPKGTGAASYADKWYNPWTKNTDPMAKGETALMNTGRAAMGVGAGAAGLAGGIAAAPALGTAGSAAMTTARTALPAAARGAGQAYKTYQTASSPLISHGAKLLPQAARPMAQRVIGTTATGITGANIYGTYNSAANATADSAQRLAQQAGVSDQKVLDEVGQRARGQMLPMAYRAMAPSWLGGDSTPVGKQLRSDMGTMAYHNVGPSMLLPSQSAKNMSTPQRAMMGAFVNPVSAVSSAVLPARPSAQQMWNNVPQQQRKQIGQNVMNAATMPGSENSALAQSMGHIFQPVVQHHQQQAQNFGSQLAQHIPGFGGGFGQ